MNKIKNISIVALVLVLGAIVFSFSWNKQRKTVFNNIDIELLSSEEVSFIDQSAVEAMLKNHGGFVMGQLIDSVNIQSIEDRIINNPYVKSAEVNFNIDGGLVVAIDQRIPVMRIVSGDMGFYIDEDGYSMPLSNEYTARVMPCTGFDGLSQQFFTGVSSVSKDSVLYGVWSLVKKIRDDKFFSSQFVQVDLSSRDDIVLIPRVGNHEIHFGKAINIDDKLSKLSVFYEKGIEQSNWNIYKSIDLRYKDQVVCKKIK